MTFKSDTRALRSLGRQLREAKPAMYRGMQKGIRAEAAKVAERAKANASWSTRIPGTVKASVSGFTTAKVSAGGTNAPHAAAYEHAGAQGTFRHPVYGNREVWVDENARPYLHKAAWDHLQESADAIARIVLTALEEEIGRI